MKKKTKDIIPIAKILSLLLVGIILCKFIILNNATIMNATEIYYKIIFFSIPILVIILFYFLCTLSNKNFCKRKSIIFNIIETTIFIILFTSIILITGGYKSEYKYILLIIIITSSIQFKMFTSLVIACICSLIILSIDIIVLRSLASNIYFQNDLILSSIFILTSWILSFHVKIYYENIEQLKKEINLDSLTQIYNHKYFHISLKEYIDSATINNSKVAMLFLDIDDFKYYNDTNGHKNGDWLLKSLSSTIKDTIGPLGMVARYGGEEFAIILPNKTESEAIIIGENLRKKIEITDFLNGKNQPAGKLTVSIGVSIYPDKAKDNIDLIKSADDALYRAKFFNKNRVEVYTSILDEIQKNINSEDKELVASFKTLISVINAKDKYTYAHSERVVMYSKLVAKKLKLTEHDKKLLIYSAYMHDIGKINIPKDILIKKMKLTDMEWETLKSHPRNSAELIKKVHSLNEVVPIVLSHHERFDGSGYPNRLKGYDIPYLARILSIIDSYDAMTSNRPYNIRKPCTDALNELVRCSGTQFDPELVTMFVDLMNENSSIIL